ncbi:hypothetical protein [Trueperella pyogenes]|uniref:hypothetical protein n=1 Tax=Trueperella pyogenes TaxID=1661 RepID=UPI00345DEA5E
MLNVVASLTSARLRAWGEKTQPARPPLPNLSDRYEEERLNECWPAALEMPGVRP